MLTKELVFCETYAWAFGISLDVFGMKSNIWKHSIDALRNLTILSIRIDVHRTKFYGLNRMFDVIRVSFV